MWLTFYSHILLCRFFQKSFVVLSFAWHTKHPHDTKINSIQQIHRCFVWLQGNFRCLKLLLNKGANWKEKDNEGQTAMHLSTRHKSNKCLALLMKQLEMAEIDDQDKNKVSMSSCEVLVLLDKN